MKSRYSQKEFGLLIGKTTNTLQRWDRKGILKAHRSITKRRYYLDFATFLRPSFLRAPPRNPAVKKVAK